MWKHVLAKAFRSRTELRNSACQLQQDEFGRTEEELSYLLIGMLYLSALDLKDVQEVIVGQPASLKGCCRKFWILFLLSNKVSICNGN